MRRPPRRLDARPADADEAYSQLLASAERDGRVVGVFVGGSHGKAGMATERSDYDVYLITNEPLGASDTTYRSLPGLIDLIPYTLDGFAGHAEPGDEMEWNRYTFAHASVALDKLDGEIARLVADKGRPPPATARTATDQAIDGYINQYYRSLKNARDGRVVAARLDAAESIPYFLTALFGVFGRLRPYNKFLDWELANHPLPGRLWARRRLVPRLVAIVAKGRIDQQRALFHDFEPVAREHGHGEVIDAWGKDLPLIRGEDDA